MQKICKKHHCETCTYITSRKSSYNNHLLSRKHILATSGHIIQPIICNNFECNVCNKKYKNRSGLWRHKNKCIQPLVITEEKELPKTDIINEVINKLIQENQSMRDFMIEQNQEMIKLMVNQKNTTVNGNVNNNNKFNINVFLNEKCKDAMNFSNFVENIEVSHEDLENNVQLGFVNGMSKIILDNLKQLSIYERPLHCTDVKRETMYIKDENKWEKEEDTKKLNNAIRQVSRKSMATLCNWREENPECQDVNSDLSDKCNAMTQNCSAGGNRDVLYPKVIRALAKETIIDKTNLIE